MENEKKYKCNKCDGKGYLEESFEVETIEIHHMGSNIKMPGRSNVKTCPKCRGEGELDWIENIKGKKSLSLSYITTFDISKMIPAFPIENEIIDKLSKDMATEIDKELLRKMVEEV